MQLDDNMKIAGKICVVSCLVSFGMCFIAIIHKMLKLVIRHQLCIKFIDEMVLVNYHNSPQ